MRSLPFRGVDFAQSGAKEFGENQFGGGWAMEGVRTVSPICVLGAPSRHWSISALVRLEAGPGLCVYAWSWVGGGGGGVAQGGGSPGAQSRAFASTKPLLTSLSRNPSVLRTVSGALAP